MRSVILLFVFLLSSCTVTEPPKPVRQYVADMGMVISVENCSHSKHSLTCDVTTNYWKLPDQDIYDYPGDYLTFDDHIYWDITEYKDEISFKRCKLYSNGLHCIPGFWMECPNGKCFDFRK